MNSEPKSLQETIDSLCNGLSDDQIERRNKWIAKQPNKQKRRAPGQITVFGKKDVRISYLPQPRLIPAEIDPSELDKLTRNWVQKCELPSLLKNGHFQVEAKTEFSAPSKIVDPRSLTSSMRINPQDESIEVWGSATARRMKHPSLFTLIGVLLFPPGTKQTDQNEVDVWGCRFKLPITSSRLAEQIFSRLDMRAQFTNENGSFNAGEIRRFHQELLTAAKATDRSVAFEADTLCREFRARKNAAVQAGESSADEL